MASQDHGLRQCPTRIDGASVLFAHKVSQAQCQERQRGQYHKCFTCAYNNAYVAAHGLPQAQAAKTEAAKTEAAKPARAGEPAESVRVG